MRHCDVHIVYIKKGIFREETEKKKGEPNNDFIRHSVLFENDNPTPQIFLIYSTSEFDNFFLNALICALQHHQHYKQPDRSILDNKVVHV